ncbi:MAG: TrkA family potassium uptake protein [Eubacteriales bacterium]|nr:TrkA family potassium uptake protein [Sarcina sp.]MBR2729436.1 TrkA family potassium uptake protein [Lachnospiraceae bacterium]MDO4417559.1 TrkA family potassium uptake protein [Eubacteriales bacterium]
MKKNFLIIGAGRFGRYAAIRLHDLGHQVMVVDKEESRINKIMLFASDARIGDSTDKAFLQSLGVRNFDACLVTIGDDFLSSLQTTFTLQELGAREVIARATSSRQEKFLLRNGADAVVFPERELGFWTAIRYSSDSISNYVDLSDGYGILEINVPERWIGRKIGDLNVRRKYHVNILGLRNEQGRPDMDIRSDTTLQQGQTMLVLGKTEHVQKIL